MKKVILGMSVLTILASCGSSSGSNANGNEREVVSKLAADNLSAEELEAQKKKLEEIKQKQAKEKAEKQTTMDFDQRLHDFGTIPAETEVSHVFKVMNTGEKPLVIEEAKATCGCTIPKKPEAPIAPGEEGELMVTFKPKKNQTGRINKKVTVTANVPEGQVFLTITANVLQGMSAE